MKPLKKSSSIVIVQDGFNVVDANDAAGGGWGTYTKVVVEPLVILAENVGGSKLP